MNFRVTTTAEARFDSARQLPGLPASHPASRVHGHGFVANVWAGEPVPDVAFAGDEVPALERRLTAAVAELDHRLLNELVSEPGDEQLARWLVGRVGMAGWQRMSVASLPTRGVEVGEDGLARVWRRYRFESAHRLPNVPLGHKCGRLHGHGFEAVVLAAVQPGEASHLAADRLDEAWAPLHGQLNHACLNELPDLENPTSEMLSVWLWQRLANTLEGLAAVRVYETASCGAHFDGAEHRIWKDFHLDSAVRLGRAPAGHPDARVHGHTFLLRLHLRAPLDTVRGWAVDFGDVKELFKPVFKALDHHPWHENPALADADVGSVAGWALAQARERLPQVDRVDLFQTPGCGVAVCTGDARPARGA